MESTLISCEMWGHGKVLLQTSVENPFDDENSSDSDDSEEDKAADLDEDDEPILS